MKHRFKLRALALGEGAEKDTIGELRALIGRSGENALLRAVRIHEINFHRELGEKVRHGGDGLVALTVYVLPILAVLVFKLLVVGERVALLIVRHGADVELHIVKAVDTVFDRDGLGALVTGHDVFKIIKEVCVRVAAAGGLDHESAGTVAPDDRIGGKNRNSQHCNGYENQSERKEPVCHFFHVPAPP